MRKFSTAALLSLVVIAGTTITTQATANFWSDNTSPQAYAAWKKTNLPQAKENQDICYDKAKDIISIRDGSHAAVVFHLSMGFYQGISPEWASQFQHARLCNALDTKAGVWIEIPDARAAGLAPLPPANAGQRAPKNPTAIVGHP